MLSSFKKTSEPVQDFLGLRLRLMSETKFRSILSLPCGLPCSLGQSQAFLIEGKNELEIYCFLNYLIFEHTLATKPLEVKFHDGKIFLLRTKVS